VKRAAARAIPGWVTSWEVWYGEPKADSIVSLGVGRYSLIVLMENQIDYLELQSVLELSTHEE